MRDVMTREPLTARPDMTLRELANEVIAFGYHTAYPVVRNGLAAGLVSRETASPRRRGTRNGSRIRRMVPPDRAIVLREDTLAVDAAAEMAEDDGGRALVVADGRLVGVVSLADVARVLDVLCLRSPP